MSVSAAASYAATVKYDSEKTQPNINVMGCDDNYFAASGFEIEQGRNFTEMELRFGRLNDPLVADPRFLKRSTN